MKKCDECKKIVKKRYYINEMMVCYDCCLVLAIVNDTIKPKDKQRRIR